MVFHKLGQKRVTELVGMCVFDLLRLLISSASILNRNS